MNTYSELLRYRPMVERMAQSIRRLNGSTNWEDIAQEGYIEVWKLLEKGETRQGYILRAAKNRMISQLIHFRDFKHPEVKHHYEIEAHKPYVGEGVGIENNIWADLEAVDDVESMAIAYHNGEIADAIASLTPNQRRYVELRFYKGLTHSQIERIFGYNPGCVWSDKRNGARVALESKLSHLLELTNG